MQNVRYLKDAEGSPLKWIAVMMTLAALSVAFVLWSEHHDAQVDQAYQKYENCVKAQYGMSPSTYYQAHGTTPECQ